MSLGLPCLSRNLRLHLPIQEMQVQSLVGGEDPMFPGAKRSKCKKQKQYCKKSDNDFYNDPHQIILKK